MSGVRRKRPGVTLCGVSQQGTPSRWLPASFSLSFSPSVSPTLSSGEGCSWKHLELQLSNSTTSPGLHDWLMDTLRYAGTFGYWCDLISESPIQGHWRASLCRNMSAHLSLSENRSLSQSGSWLDVMDTCLCVYETHKHHMSFTPNNQMCAPFFND